MFLTIIGFTIKVTALFNTIDDYKNNILYRNLEILIGIQLIQSLGEFFAYTIPPEFWLADYFLRAYYLTSFITAVLGPIVVAEVIGFHIPKKLIEYSYRTVFIFIIFLFFSDLIIAGTSHTGINLTRIAGPFYWIFQLTIIGSIFATFYILIKSKSQNNGLNKLKVTNLAFSFSPYAMFIILIIFLMIFFKGVNATGILPIFMSVFLLSLAHSISSKKVYDLTYWVPFSRRRRLINRLVRPLITASEDGVDTNIKKEYDAIVAQHALQLFNGNQTKAAVWLKTSQSWVSRHEVT
jgi:hypothetical protein